MAQKELGSQVSEKLHALINLLESAETLADISQMRQYHLHPLQGDRKGEYALDLGRNAGFRLIIIPLDDEEKEWIATEVNVIYRSTKIILAWEVSKHYE